MPHEKKDTAQNHNANPQEKSHEPKSAAEWASQKAYYDDVTAFLSERGVNPLELLNAINESIVTNHLTALIIETVRTSGPIEQEILIKKVAAVLPYQKREGWSWAEHHADIIAKLGWAIAVGYLRYKDDAKTTIAGTERVKKEPVFLQAIVNTQPPESELLIASLDALLAHVQERYREIAKQWFIHLEQTGKSGEKVGDVLNKLDKDAVTSYLVNGMIQLLRKHGPMKEKVFSRRVAKSKFFNPKWPKKTIESKIEWAVKEEIFSRPESGYIQVNEESLKYIGFQYPELSSKQVSKQVQVTQTNQQAVSTQRSIHTNVNLALAARVSATIIYLGTVGVCEDDKLEEIILACDFPATKNKADFEKIVEFELNQGHLRKRSLPDGTCQIICGEQLEKDASEWTHLLKTALGKPDSKEDPYLDQILPKHLLKISQDPKAAKDKIEKELDFPPQFEDKRSNFLVLLQKLKSRDKKLPTRSKLAEEIGVNVDYIEELVNDFEQNKAQAVLKFVKQEGEKEERISYRQSPLTTLKSTALPLKLIATQHPNLKGKELLEALLSNPKLQTIFDKEKALEETFGFYLSSLKIFIQCRLENWYWESRYLKGNIRESVNLGARYEIDKAHLDLVLMDDNPKNIKRIVAKLQIPEEKKLDNRVGIALIIETVPGKKETKEVRGASIVDRSISEEEFNAELKQITAEYEGKLAALAAKTTDDKLLYQAWCRAKNTGNVVEKRACEIHNLPENTVSVTFRDVPTMRKKKEYHFIQTLYKRDGEKSYTLVNKGKNR